MKSFDAMLARAEGWALILILALLMAVAFLQVLLRNLFDTALPWGDGLTRALVLWAGFIGASLAVHEGRYLNLDLLTRWMSERWKLRARLLVYLYSGAVSLCLSLAGVIFVGSERSARSMTSLGIPSWLVSLVIPAALFCISFRFALKALLLVRGEAAEERAWER